MAARCAGGAGRHGHDHVAAVHDVDRFLPADLAHRPGVRRVATSRAAPAGPRSPRRRPARRSSRRRPSRRSGSGRRCGTWSCPASRSSNIASRGLPRSSATRYSSWACPTSSWTLAVRASLRRRVGARISHSRSGRTPISSLLACISTKRRTAVRYSSGIQSVASTLSPAATCASNSAYRSSWGRSSLKPGPAAVERAEDRFERERVGHGRAPWDWTARRDRPAHRKWMLAATIDPQPRLTNDR